MTALAAVLPDSVRAPTAKVAQVGNAKSIAVTIPDRNQNLRVPICVRTVDGKRKKLDAFSDEIHSKTPDKVKLPKSSRKARTARIAVRKMRTSGRGLQLTRCR